MILPCFPSSLSRPVLSVSFSDSLFNCPQIVIYCNVIVLGYEEIVNVLSVDLLLLMLLVRFPPRQQDVSLYFHDQTLIFNASPFPLPSLPYQFAFESERKRQISFTYFSRCILLSLFIYGSFGFLLVLLPNCCFPCSTSGI